MIASANRPIRVVVAIEGMFAFGGTERQAVDIACGMQSRGYDVTLLSRWPLDVDNIYLSELEDGGVHVHPRGWTGASRRRRLHVVLSRAVSFGRVSTLRRHAWRWQVGQLRNLAAASPTIVHEVPFFGDVSPQGVAAPARIGLPVVQTILGTPLTPVHLVAPWAVATSDGQPKLTPPGRGFTWVPTMGPPAQPLPARSPATNASWRGLFVGRLVPSKGVELLVRAWAQLPGTPQLTVIGDGESMSAVAALVAQCRANIILVGALKRRDILRELERAHLLVAPSIPSKDLPTEGVPTVLAEAMWAGLPVIASRVGGVAELFADARPGWLVEPDDEAGLVAALVTAMEPSEYARAARDAQVVFQKILAPTAVLDRYEEAYKRAVRTRASCIGLSSPVEHTNHRR